MRVPPFFIFDSRPAPIDFTVSLVLGRWSETYSHAAYSSSADATGVTPSAFIFSAGT